MTRGRLLAAALTALLLAGPTAAEAPATQPGAADVEGLIRRLSDDAWSNRERAKEELAALGERVEPRLKALVRATDDPEIRSSAQSVLDRIEEDRAAGPTLLTLHLQNVDPKSAIEAIEQQCHADIDVWPPNMWKHLERRNGSITLHADAQPFWHVMRELSRQTGLWPHQRRNMQQFTLHVDEDGPHSAPTVVSGPFMVVATGASESASVTYGDPPRRERRRTVTLQFYAEPKLNVLGHAHGVRITEFTDGDGLSLPLPAHAGNGVRTHGTEDVWTVDIDLPQELNALKKIGRLAGKTSATVQTRSRKVQVPDVLEAKGAEVSAEGHQLLINEVVQDEAGIRFKITVILSGPQPGGRRAVDSRDFILLDENGKPLKPRSASGGGNGRKFNFDLSFQNRREQEKPARPAMLVWEVPLEAKEVEIPFEFTDLPLP